MLVGAFYNQELIGDILLIRLQNKEVDHYQKIDDLCMLYDDENTLLGLNIFNASAHFSQLDTGLVSLKDPFEQELNALLDKYDVDSITVDKTGYFKVGRILEVEDHPDSNHLHICKVDLKDDVKTIVCGAKNVEVGILVVVALPNAIMPNGLFITPSSLRGVDSYGMICSSRELNLHKNILPKGNILILDDSKYHVGDDFDVIEEGK